jgi:L-ascorbate metabolism protein UlaG (beta-lactamase superfamily)
MLDLSNITWLGHDGFRIIARGDRGEEATIYIDPYRLKGDAPPADLILITHQHSDHLSPEDIAKLRTGETSIVASARAAKELADDVVTVRPGETVTVKGITIEAVPAYNLNKFRAPGQLFHPKEHQGVGYVVTANGVRIYHAGDTDFIPEMRDLRVDVALLPVSGTYVMTADEAVEAANAIQPQVAIPMHFASIVGSDADAQKFAREATVPVKVMTASV